MARSIPCSFISFLHNRDIFCCFGSFLADSDRFQLTSTTSTFSLVELVVIKHGCNVVSCSYRQPQGGCFAYSWHSPEGWAMPLTLFKVSNITSVEYLLISYHFKCLGMFRAFTIDSGRFQLTSSISTTLWLVELVVIKHGHHMVSCSYWQPRGGCFSYSWCSLKGCTKPPTLFEVLKITSIEY